MIEAPITTTKVANELQISNHNVGYLCSNQHGKINKWAKYKPIDYNGIPDRSTDWYKNTDGWCGFYPMGTSGDLKYECDNGHPWEYVPPKGGSSSPYRLADFDGYNPNARPFLRTGVVKDSIRTVQTSAIVSSTTISITIQYDMAAYSGGLTLDDFGTSSLADIDFDTAKCCVSVYSSTGSLKGTYYASGYIKDASISAIDAVVSSGDWVYYGISVTDGTVGNTFIPIPWDDNNYYKQQISLKYVESLRFTLSKLGTDDTPLQDVSSSSTVSVVMPLSNQNLIAEYTVENTTDTSQTMQFSASTTSGAYNFTVQNYQNSQSLSGYITMWNNATVSTNVTKSIPANSTATFRIRYTGEFIGQAGSYYLTFYIRKYQGSTPTLVNNVSKTVNISN